nr:immunoglobulin heavy chain junction region [Mus musculus]
CAKEGAAQAGFGYW